MPTSGRRPSVKIDPVNKVWAGILGIALAVAIAAGGWWVSGRFAERVSQARADAQAVAAALTAGRVPDGAGAGVVEPPDDLSRVLAGMGSIPHEVAADGVDLTNGGDVAQIGLRHTWRVQADKPPWTYRTTAHLDWTDDGWRLAWDPAVLAPGLGATERLSAERLQGQRGRVLGVGDEVFDPQEPLARPLLGRVGPATKKVADASGGRVHEGDTTGLSGLQAAQDATLSGAVGYAVRAVDDGDGATGGAGDGGAGSHTSARELHRVDPVDGTDVRVSLDRRVQEVAERVLAAVGPASAIVAIRPSDGHVLAAASGPGSQGYSTATLGQYSPGSTFKMVTAEALLASGMTPDSPVHCTPTATAGGWPFRNYSDYPPYRLGTIPLRTAIAESCNTALINAADVATPQAMTAAATALGLLAEPSLGTPAYLGQFPTDVNSTQHGAGLIGQGHVLASPLGMATVAASVGAMHTVTPVLMLPAEEAEEAEGPAPTVSPGATATGSPSPSPSPTPSGPPVPSGPELASIMRGVVAGGTASFLRDVPGEPVLAKTGTAEYGTEDPPRTRAWMIGVQGDLAVSVFVEDGKSGSGTAGPLLERFLRGVAR